MDELIKRQAVLDQIELWARYDVPDVEAPIDLVERILELPSEPVGNSDTLRPKGKWKDYGTCVMDIGDVQELVCSECGATTFWADYYPLPVMPRYCHNCGARFEVAVDMAKGEEYRF